MAIHSYRRENLNVLDINCNLNTVEAAYYNRG